jgi:hypothetical protein
LLTTGERPGFDPDLPGALDTAFRAAVTDIFPDHRPGTDRLFAGTHQLDCVAQCEGRAVAEMTNTFTWTLATVRRGLTIEAIRTWVAHRRATTTTVAATRALAWATAGGNQQTMGDLNRGVFLENLDPHTRSGLVADIAGALAAYDTLVDRDVDHYEIRFSQHTGIRTPQVVLRAPVDLICGRANNPGDPYARKLLVNFTLRDTNPAQLTNLARAALYDTIATGSPPRRCATVSLDPGGELPVAVLDVTPEQLWDTAHQTIDLIARLAWLDRHRGAPVLRPGEGCEHCPLAVTCPARMAA